MSEKIDIDTSSNVGAALAFAATVTEPLVLSVPFEGKLVITLNFVTGPDGSQTYTCEEKVTKAKIPAKSSMTFTDGDGELTGRPAEPLTELAYDRQKKSTEKSGGSQTYTCEEKVTKAKIPARSSMTFTDGDGELTGRPVEPLTEEMYRREHEKKPAKTNAEPKVGNASNL